MKHKAQQWLLLLVVATGLVGCTQTKEIEKAVVEANLAMVDRSAIGLPGAAENDDWLASVKNLDSLITRYAENPALSNSLRVRQAMLLTVNQQDNLALPAWSAIQRDTLKAERDLAFYDNNAALVWIYNAGPAGNINDDDELRIARGYITSLAAAVASSRNANLKNYLGTIRAQVALKVAQSADPLNNQETIRELQSLVTEAGQFVTVFTTADQDWVRSNRDGSTAGSDSVQAVRNRVTLLNLLKKFRQIHAGLADYLDSSQPHAPIPGWNPAWIGTVETTDE